MLGSGLTVNRARTGIYLEFAEWAGWYVPETQRHFPSIALDVGHTVRILVPVIAYAVSPRKDTRNVTSLVPIVLW